MIWIRRNKKLCVSSDQDQVIFLSEQPYCGEDCIPRDAYQCLASTVTFWVCAAITGVEPSLGTGGIMWLVKRLSESPGQGPVYIKMWKGEKIESKLRCRTVTRWKYLSTTKWQQENSQRRLKRHRCFLVTWWCEFSPFFLSSHHFHNKISLVQINNVMDKKLLRSN